MSRSLHRIPVVHGEINEENNMFLLFYSQDAFTFIRRAGAEVPGIFVDAWRPIPIFERDGTNVRGALLAR